MLGRLRERFWGEDSERIKLNADIEFEDVVSVTWYPATRIADVYTESHTPHADLETVKGVYKIICDDMHQTVRGEAFTAKERTDPAVTFKFFEPREGGFDEAKGTLWID